MRSSTTRFAALALSLFLSSRDETFSVLPVVESFQAAKPVTRMAPSRSASTVNHRGYNKHFYCFRSNDKCRLSMVANPGGNDDSTSTLLNNQFNDTLADPSALAEAERAWALESADESHALTPEPPKFDLLSAEVLGPVGCVVFTIGFLCWTLLNSGGISDSFANMELGQKIALLGKISWFPGRFQEAQLVVGLVMAFSAFAQALTGFGFAVVAVGAMSSMPWLLHSELYDVITPVAATLGALVGFILLLPYVFAEGPPTEEEPGLDWGEILPLLIPCTVLTPLGIQLNNMVDPILGTRVLAALIMGFVAYKLVPTVQETFGLQQEEAALENPQVAMVTGDASGAAPVEVIADDGEEDFLQSRTAAILFGSAAGIFGGAFDVQGPPLCVYGDAKGWSPAKFRNNVLAVVCLNSAFVVAIDSFQGVLGNFYYCYFCLTSLPGVLLGVVAGQYASKRIDPILFKNLVLIMCLGLGIQLLRVS